MYKKTSYKKALQLYNDSAMVIEHNPALLFNNLIWMTTKEAAVYLRKSVNSIHKLVAKGELRARKFKNRLYFKREEIDYLIETSNYKRG